MPRHHDSKRYEFSDVNGRVPHSMLLEIFTDKGVGTEIAK
jgi:acetylglutamate kinase